MVLLRSLESPLRALSIAAVALAMTACGDSVETQGSGGKGSSTSTSTRSTSASSGSETTSSEGTANGPSTGTNGVTSGSSGTGGAVGCLMDVSAGHHKASCAGGIDYDVEIPAACTQGSCGLIVDLHGYTMTGDSEDKNTNMRALGEQNGYVVVQPTAPKDTLQQPAWDQPTHVPLVFTFLSDLAQSLPIDPKRIHAMGFSQGGGMTFRLLCTHADFFASGAPGSALPGCEFTGTNQPSQEVDILQVHGVEDGVLNFQTYAVPQRDAVLNGGWPFGQPTVLETDAKHTATRWVTTSGTVFEFWQHDYQTNAVVLIPLKGHCVPGGNDFNGTPAGYSCDDTNTFVFGQLAMQFFMAHPKS
jgi:polyhydroxybutyrate depolymerase